MSSSQVTQSSMLQHIHAKIVYLYQGNSALANRFRWALLAIDILTINYFIVSSFFPLVAEFRALELAIGAYYLIEFIARTFISKSKLRDILHPVGLADLIVIASLFAPSLAANFTFLRVARALRLLRSYHMLKTLRKQSKFVRTNEDILFSVANLLVFIFVITAVVFVSQHEKNPGIANYVDALYFTISTLTTTGFGDITLLGTDGHILAVLIMIFGISLFLRLIQTIFRPAKVKFPCPSCGLTRHESDAVHCKHCGEILRITTEGNPS